MFLEVVQLILRPPPPSSKGGGGLLAWGGCYVGETVESIWLFEYVFVEIECLEEFLKSVEVD
jgi:hypothetical protein